MTMILHQDVLDFGLSTISTASLKIAVCQTQPTALAHITNLSGAGGKRVSNEVTLSGGEAVLENGTTGTRQVRIPTKLATIAVAVTAGTADLWIAVYDATRMLVLTSQMRDEGLAVSQQVQLSKLIVRQNTVI